MRYARLLVCLSVLWFSSTTSAKGKDTITFPAKDGLLITADIYLPHKNKSTPLIVLFHQAGWSRGEYLEIAHILNEMGFNCMAIDQRSGRAVNGVENETAKRASKAGKNTTYADALVDIESALIYARKHYEPEEVIAWGSSYSAALVLKVAGDNAALVDGALAFAPGEYFSQLGKSATWIQESANQIDVPVFITSARREKGKWSAIYASIKSTRKVSFLPTSGGNHGSRALWKQFEDSGSYWDAVKLFLKKNFTVKRQ